ncbi:MAG: DUF4142 domain-containing protein [Verrucomicrobia bacterium]|nr:DUF4142 domain-containing protein [Verrucomicrobiota bacterium]
MKLSPVPALLACLALTHTPLVAQQTLVNVASGILLPPPEDRDPINPTDKDFIKTTSQGLRFEVFAGKLAATHASDNSVKQFGQYMIRDHSADLTSLLALALEEAVPLPPGLSEDQANELQKLQALYGADFDREYIRYEIGNHQMDIDNYSKEAQQGIDFDVRRYATDGMTEFLERLTMAQDVGKLIGLSTANPP